MGRLPSRLPVYPFGDNEKLQFGTGADYSVYFDGTNFLIDSGTHSLEIDLETAGKATIYGGDTSGDDLKLQANSVNAYSYLELVGNGDISLCCMTGADIMLLDASTIILQMDGGNDNININSTGISSHYDLALLGDGILCLKEGATPTADTNYGKVYCKNTNQLFFQDGAGAEHLITMS